MGPIGLQSPRGHPRHHRLQLLAGLPGMWPAADSAVFPADLYQVTVHDETAVKASYAAALRLLHPDKLKGPTFRPACRVVGPPRPLL